jgi:hypothetical protein
MIVGTNVKEMMTSNDGFILGSVMLNKTQAYTWIWPSWDVRGKIHYNPRTQLIRNNGRFINRVGAMKIRSKLEETIPVGCQCLYRAGEEETRVICEFGDESYEDEFEAKYGRGASPTGQRNIERKCDFTHRINVQHLSELEMIKGKYTKTHKMDSAKMVLDIDLDYFGCVGKLLKNQFFFFLFFLFFFSPRPVGCKF